MHILFEQEKRMRYQRFGGVFALSVSSIFIMSSGVAQADPVRDQEILEAINNGTFVNTKIQVPLSEVEVPEPSNLDMFVADRDAALALGKALFWDMQIGSDGVQACASCHFAAGADSRAKNQLSPGLLRSNQDATGNPDNTFDTGPNYHLSSDDFPTHLVEDVLRFESNVIRSSNDIVSSQGVTYTEFLNARTGRRNELGLAVDDPNGFQVPDTFTGEMTNVRRVEPRNTPTVVNAVFNVRNFWDGRAEETFNGVNPEGDGDPSAFVYEVVGGELVATNVSIDHSSVASQAMAPPVSNLEMSAADRPWVEIGDKVSASDALTELGRTVRGLKPLRGQMVDPSDSVLGSMSAYPNTGLNVGNYDSLIREAFREEWWDSSLGIRVNEDGSHTIVPSAVGTGDVYSQLEMNFSLFFGLAVQMYQATLVSDQTRFDDFVAGDINALTDDEKLGFFIAHEDGRCFNCHGGPETTFASFSRIEGLTLKDGTVLTDGRGLTRIRGENLIDEGFNNIGVSSTLEDLGVGGLDATGAPLSYGRQTHLGDFDNPQIEGIDTELEAFLGADGAFKIPTLRNVELTAPYFHNGSAATLEQVIELYFRGGNFREFLVTGDDDTDHPVQGFDATREHQILISGLGVLSGPNFNQTGLNQIGQPAVPLDDDDKAHLVAIMRAMTDERVRTQAAPFDHPQLFVPNGHPGDESEVIGLFGFDTYTAVDEFMEIPATGAAGGTPVPTFAENLDD